MFIGYIACVTLVVLLSVASQHIFEVVTIHFIADTTATLSRIPGEVGIFSLSVTVRITRSSSVSKGPYKREY
jgi:hypothetical protein